MRSIAKQRTAWPISWREWSATAFSLGLLLSLVNFALLVLPISLPGVLGGYAGRMAMLLVPYAIALLWLCCVAQSWGAVLIAGALVALPYFPVLGVGWLLLDGDGGARQDWGVVAPSMAAVTCVAALVGAALAALVRMVVRAFIVKLVTPEPDVCAGCGYPLGRDERITRCPECGLARSEGDVSALRPAHTSSRVLRGAPWLLAVLVVAMGAWIVQRVVRVTLPIRSFDRALAAHTRGQGYAFLAMATGHGAPSIRYELRTESLDYSEKVLVYAFTPNPPAGFPAMRIAVAVLPQWQLVNVGANPVFVDLNHERADQILRLRGAPASLRSALMSRAVEIGWTPSASAAISWPTGTPLEADRHFIAEHPR